MKIDANPAVELKPESPPPGQGKVTTASRETPLPSTTEPAAGDPQTRPWFLAGLSPFCPRKGLQGELYPSFHMGGPEEEAPTPKFPLHLSGVRRRGWARALERATLCHSALCWRISGNVRTADFTPCPDSLSVQTTSPPLKSLPHPRSSRREEAAGLLWPSPFSRNKWRGRGDTQAWGRGWI